MASAIAATLALILLILILFVVFYFVFFHKNKGFQYSDLPAKPCSFDADCRIASGQAAGVAIVESCIKQAGNATGTCSAYCLINSDCGAGNVGGSTTCTQDNYGRFLCTLAPEGSGCQTGEVPVTIPQAYNTTNDTGSYCLILGLNPLAPQPEPRLCTNQDPWNVTNLYCTFDNLPTNFHQPCYWTEDCGTGYNCSNGCSLSTAGGSSGCTGQTPGYCTPQTGTNVGYVAQCNDSNPCPSGTCTTGLCTVGSGLTNKLAYNPPKLPATTRRST